MNEIQQPDEIDAHAGGTSSPLEDDRQVVSGKNSTPLKDIVAAEKKFSPYCCSSIGPAEATIIPERVYRDNDKVTKNFCTEVKTSADAVVDVFNQVESYTLAEGARLNIRFITTLDHLAQAIKGKDWGNYIEGVTPLTGCGVAELEGMCIINLGRIGPARPFDSNQYTSLLTGAKAIYDQQGNVPPKEYVVPHGYHFEVFDNNDSETKKEVVELLIKFAWADQKDAEAIASSSEMRFGLMICDEYQDESGKTVPRKVASLIGIESREMALTVSGNTVRFVVDEVAEAITLKTHKGKGLYGCANTMMMRHLVKAGKTPNILIGEANLHNPAAIKNAFEQGRNCGLMQDEIRQKLMIALAALRADFTILEENDPLSNDWPNCLLPTYQTMEQILETYGGNNK